MIRRGLLRRRLLRLDGLDPLLPDVVFAGAAGVGFAGCDGAALASTTFVPPPPPFPPVAFPAVSTASC